MVTKQIIVTFLLLLVAVAYCSMSAAEEDMLVDAIADVLADELLADKGGFGVTVAPGGIRGGHGHGLYGTPGGSGSTVIFQPQPIGIPNTFQPIKPIVQQPAPTVNNGGVTQPSVLNPTPIGAPQLINKVQPVQIPNTGFHKVPTIKDFFPCTFQQVDC